MKGPMKSYILSFLTSTLFIGVFVNPL